MIRLVFLGIIAFMFSSCVITEDVTFSENGTVKYQLAIDMSQLSNNGAGSPMQGMPTEPFSIVQMFKDSISTGLDALSTNEKKELDELLADLEPFYMKAQSEDEEEQYTFKLFGDFKDVNQLNRAIIALDRSKELETHFKGKEQNTEGENQAPPFSLAGKQFTFVWNGKQMQRNYLQTEKVENVIEEVEEVEDDSLVGNMVNKMMGPMMQMLEMGQYITKYHFPKKIKHSNIESGEFSEDGKTLTITQAGLNFIEPEFGEIIVDLK